jgi:hypothetical protein
VSASIPEDIRALIPEGIRPELAHGIALWLAGASTIKAAREAGVPQQTLWENVNKLPDAVKAGRVTMAQVVQQIAYPVMREAYAQLGERLTDDNAKPLSAMELNVVAGTAADKIVNAQRIIQGGDHAASGLDTLLGKLVESGGGTITVEPHRTIDVTPRKESE